MKFSKNLVLVLVALMLSVGVSFAYDGATPYTLTVSTFEVTGVLADGGTITPDITGWARVVKVDINVISTTTVQTVNFYYNTTTSSGTITLAHSTDFTTDTAEVANASAQNRSLSFLAAGNGVSNAFWKIQNLTIRKSNVNSAVKVTVWYLQ